MSDNPVREPDYDLEDTQPIVGLPLDRACWRLRPDHLQHVTVAALTADDVARLRAMDAPVRRRPRAGCDCE